MTLSVWCVCVLLFAGSQCDDQSSHYCNSQKQKSLFSSESSGSRGQEVTVLIRWLGACMCLFFYLYEARYELQRCLEDVLKICLSV